MGKIATEQEAYNIGGSGSYTTNKCCTKSRAEELGCNVSGSYTSSRLVQLEDLSGIRIQGFTISANGSAGWICTTLNIGYFTGSGSAVYYYGGSQSTDSSFTLSWSGGTPTYSGNAGTANILIYTFPAASFTEGQQIGLNVKYGSISKSAYATIPANSSVTAEPYIDRTGNGSNPYVYNPLSYAITVTIQVVYSTSSTTNITELTYTVAANSYTVIQRPNTSEWSFTILSWTAA